MLSLIDSIYFRSDLEPNDTSGNYLFRLHVAEYAFPGTARAQS